jgi:hypothetical protein
MTMATNNLSTTHKHLAVLIDADNAPAAIVGGLFEEIAKLWFRRRENAQTLRGSLRQIHLHRTAS